MEPIKGHDEWKTYLPEPRQLCVGCDVLLRDENTTEESLYNGFCEKCWDEVEEELRQIEEHTIADEEAAAEEEMRAREIEEEMKKGRDE